MAGRRRARAAVLATVIIAALAGCGGQPTTGAPAPTPRPTATAGLQGAPGRAVDLLPVVWHVGDAAGAGRDTYLRFSEHEVEVLQPKGFVLLGWATQGDAMITEVHGWSQRLGSLRPPAVPWLTPAAFFRRTDGGWVLLDLRGRRLATLRDDGPAPTSSTTTTTAQPVTAFARKQVADAVGGPGARTVPAAAIRGRWGVAGLDPRHAVLTVSADGGWRVRGGCASGTGQDLGGAGRLRLLPGGFVILTAQGVAGVGCVGPPVRPPADTAALVSFAQVRSLTVQHDRMTLFDRAGQRIGALTRVG